MCVKILHRSASDFAGFTLSVLLTSALSLPANAAETWKIDMAKSHFSAGTNTLVLERSPGSGKMDTRNTANGHVLVISGDKVYVATGKSAFDMSGTVKPVDYSRGKEMKVVQIGENVRSNDICSFHPGIKRATGR